MIDNYLNLFIDNDYPNFIDKYLNTKTLNRIKNVTYFCGCDYTKLYSPLFLYTRFDHSLVVAHMTWHFTHDKIQTIVALLHDVGKGEFGLNLVEKSVLVLLNNLTKGKIKKYDNIKQIDIYYNHA